MKVQGFSIDIHPAYAAAYLATSDHVPQGKQGNKYSPGRPSKISDHGLHVMSRVLLKSPRKSMKKIKCEYPDLFNQC